MSRSFVYVILPLRTILRQFWLFEACFFSFLGQDGSHEAPEWPRYWACCEDWEQSHMWLYLGKLNRGTRYLPQSFEFLIISEIFLCTLTHLTPRPLIPGLSLIMWLHGKFQRPYPTIHSPWRSQPKAMGWGRWVQLHGFPPFLPSLPNSSLMTCKHQSPSWGTEKNNGSPQCLVSEPVWVGTSARVRPVAQRAHPQ